MGRRGEGWSGRAGDREQKKRKEEVRKVYRRKRRNKLINSVGRGVGN